MAEFDSALGYVALGAAAVAVLALLLCLALTLRVRRLRADQRQILGDGSADLVAHSAAIARVVGDMRSTLTQETARTAERLATAERRLDASVSKTAVLRYDAFNESTGRQSSTVALLDDLDNGVLITAIQQRNQARVYAKPVVAGRSALELSPEEVETMERARRGPEDEASEGRAPEGQVSEAPKDS